MTFSLSQMEMWPWFPAPCFKLTRKAYWVFANSTSFLSFQPEVPWSIQSRREPRACFLCVHVCMLTSCVCVLAFFLCSVHPLSLSNAQAQSTDRSSQEKLICPPQIDTTGPDLAEAHIPLSKTHSICLTFQTLRMSQVPPEV